SFFAITAVALFVLAAGLEAAWALRAVTSISGVEGVQGRGDLRVAPEQGDAPFATPNDNRTPAGRLEDGILTLELELRMGRWFPDEDGGNALTLPVFAEAGH